MSHWVGSREPLVSITTFNYEKLKDKSCFNIPTVIWQMVIIEAIALQQPIQSLILFAIISDYLQLPVGLVLSCVRMLTINDPNVKLIFLYWFLLLIFQYIFVAKLTFRIKVPNSLSWFWSVFFYFSQWSLVHRWPLLWGVSLTWAWSMSIFTKSCMRIAWHVSPQSTRVIMWYVH